MAYLSSTDRILSTEFFDAAEKIIEKGWGVRPYAKFLLQVKNGSVHLCVAYHFNLRAWNWIEFCWRSQTSGLILQDWFSLLSKLYYYMR